MESPTSLLSLETEVIACPQQVSCNIGDETVVLTLEEGVYYALNPVASAVWKAVQDGVRVSEIRDNLMQEYEVSEDQCTEDLLEVLNQMLEWRLISLRNGSKGA